MKLIDITGKRYGRLIALRYSHISKGHYYWLFRCDCGVEKVVGKYQVMCGVVRSCGCLARESLIKGNKSRATHNKTNTRIFSIWQGVKNRCCNEKDKAYKNYGGRGVTICDEWKNDFMIFYKWSMANGYDDNLTIDRTDNDGNYEPSNCRWVDEKVQARNRRNNKIITINGENKCVSEWCEQYSINEHLFRSRIRKGWKGFDALTYKSKKVSNTSSVLDVIDYFKNLNVDKKIISNEVGVSVETVRRWYKKACIPDYYNFNKLLKLKKTLKEKNNDKK